MHSNDMWPFAHNLGYPKRLITGFLFVMVVSSLVSGILLLDRFRSYEASLDLLVVSKSTEGALEAGAARDALMLLGSQSEFFSDVNDTAGVSAIRFAPIGQTAIRLTVSADNPIDARDGVTIASQSLFETIGKYYDIRSNIGIRSLGMPRAEGVIAHPIGLFVVAVCSGMIFALLLFAILLSFARIAFRIRTREGVPTSEPVFSIIKEQREMSATLPADTFVPKKIRSNFFSFEPSLVSREKDYAHFNRGPAPANLPIAGDDAEVLPDFLFSEPEEEPTSHIADISPMVTEENIETISETSALQKIEPVVSDTPAESPAFDREPTAEEYKKRLNELLKGNFPNEKK